MFDIQTRGDQEFYRELLCGSQYLCVSLWPQYNSEFVTTNLNKFQENFKSYFLLMRKKFVTNDLNK